MSKMNLQAVRLKLAESISRGKLIASVPGQPCFQQAELGPVTQQFFAEYSLVQSPMGGLVVAASQVAPSEYIAGFISIGHSEDWDVVQRPGADEVQLDLFAGSGNRPDQTAVPTAGRPRRIASELEVFQQKTIDSLEDQVIDAFRSLFNKGKNESAGATRSNPRSGRISTGR